jgi:hypothetical protein
MFPLVSNMSWRLFSKCGVVPVIGTSRPFSYSNVLMCTAASWVVFRCQNASCPSQPALSFILPSIFPAYSILCPFELPLLRNVTQKMTG